MPISLGEMRELLLPGLMSISGSYPRLVEAWAHGFDMYGAPMSERILIRTVEAPHVWIPKPVEIVATAAALAIVKNPVVTRRFWSGWFKPTEEVTPDVEASHCHVVTQEPPARHLYLDTQ